MHLIQVELMYMAEDTLVILNTHCRAGVFSKPRPYTFKDVPPRARPDAGDIEKISASANTVNDTLLWEYC